MNVDKNLVSSSDDMVYKPHLHNSLKSSAYSSEVRGRSRSSCSHCFWPSTPLFPHCTSLSRKKLWTESLSQYIIVYTINFWALRVRKQVLQKCVELLLDARSVFIGVCNFCRHSFYVVFPML